jgi:hypothetical protein
MSLVDVFLATTSGGIDAELKRRRGRSVQGRGRIRSHLAPDATCDRSAERAEQTPVG